jgi:hypothetical protein
MTTTALSRASASPATTSDDRSIRLSIGEKHITFLIFLYWVVYENLVFFNARAFGGPALAILTDGIKLALPFYLLFFTGVPSPAMIGRGRLGLYLFFFVLFLSWALVPTVIAGDPLEWLKLVPRVVFFLSVVALFSKRPAAFSLLAKCIVVYVLSALVQYILVYWTGAYSSLLGSDKFRYMAGPFGLLGNVNSTFFLPDAPFPIVRLCGYWNEPSNASGSAFAAFFLARYLVVTGERPIWRAASYGCLAAGFLALSSAGYLALGSAVLFGTVFGPGRLTVRRLLQGALLLPVAVALLGIVVFGRSYVAKNLSDNVWAMAITGVRSTPRDSYDPSGGRIEDLRMTVDKIKVKSIGVGIQLVGNEGIDASGTAPIYWLLLTGIPGLVLLLSREAVLLASARSLLRRIPTFLPLAQALIVVMAQHLSYGSWMNPNYFIPAAMILVYSSERSQKRLAESGYIVNNYKLRQAMQTS